MNNGHNAAGFTAEGSTTPDKLNPRDTIERKATISGGQGVLPRGTVLGKVTATGEFLKSAAAAGDGSEVPDRILAEEVDTTGGDAQAITYTAGRFNQAALTLGAGHTLASIEAGLRDRNIYLESQIG